MKFAGVRGKGSMDKWEIELSGRLYTAEQLRTLLSARDHHASEDLRRQLARDVASSSSHSAALIAIGVGLGGGLKDYARNVLRKLSSGRNVDPEMLDEVYNDMLTRIYIRYPQYDARRGGFVGWLYAQMHFACLDRMREHLQQTEYERKLRDKSLLLFESYTEDFPEPPGPKELDALRRAMERLTPAQRALITARYVQGYEPVEIARSGFDEKLTTDNVRVYVKRSLERLRRLYDEERERL